MSVINCISSVLKINYFCKTVELNNNKILSVNKNQKTSSKKPKNRDVLDSRTKLVMFTTTDFLLTKIGKKYYVTAPSTHFTHNVSKSTGIPEK